ncbi:DNA topoisomerase I [Candidatus Bathyarchaeota archaeon]|nr:DNA topoisomerase I [Candidatus Bathyarchaeota archaeon]
MTRTLIICEKPDAARRLAEALADRLPPARKRHGLRYFELSAADGIIVVCPVLGHLYTVDARGSRSRREYPVWDFEWKPKYQVERGFERQEGLLRAIHELAQKADRFIDACDYDIEGSVIGYMTLKYACGGADIKAGRMRFSTLTKSDLKEAYINASAQLDHNLVQAGICRHEIDWLYGVNLSRALTESARKSSGEYLNISTGRVQGPTLKFVTEREVQISTHVPIPYWTITAQADIDERTVPLEYSKKRLEKKIEAEDVAANTRNRTGRVERIEERHVSIKPPPPFDLSELQSESYRHLHLGPSQTLRILERLYLQALISYPRTGSQKLPASIGYEAILKGLQKSAGYRDLVSELLSQPVLRPVEGGKADPAHPAVYPTGRLPRRLSTIESRVYDLVVRRFMAAFAPAAERAIQRATVTVSGRYVFYLRGSATVCPGWMRFYQPYGVVSETSIPHLREGQEILFKEVSAVQHFSAPPPRYNPGSLLRMMEHNGIGTKATRSGIIDLLYKRGYVAGEAMRPTLLATKVIEVLEKYCPKIVDVSFTRDLEVKMDRIEAGEATHDGVLSEAVKQLRPVMERLKSDEEMLGRDLRIAVRQLVMEKSMIKVPCPSCGLALRVVRSAKTRKRFIECSGSSTHQCRFTLPLPQLGRLEPLEKFCERCGFQLFATWRWGKRPLVSCPKCYVEGLRRTKSN